MVCKGPLSLAGFLRWDTRENAADEGLFDKSLAGSSRHEGLVCC